MDYRTVEVKDILMTTKRKNMDIGKTDDNLGMVK